MEDVDKAEAEEVVQPEHQPGGHNDWKWKWNEIKMKVKVQPEHQPVGHNDRIRPENEFKENNIKKVLNNPEKC